MDEKTWEEQCEERHVQWLKEHPEKQTPTADQLLLIALADQVAKLTKSGEIA